MADYTTIDDPSVYFQMKLYTAAGSYTFDGNSDMQPDWMWIKELNGTNEHNLFDSVRGVTNGVESSTTAAEFDRDTTLTAFGSDGFTVGNNGGTGQNGGNYVGWGWKAGTSVSGTTTGSGTGKAYAGSVSTTAGFSIIRYLGNGTDGHTIPHHLGVAPRWIFTKRLDSASAGDWTVLHMGFTGGASDFIELNSTGAKQTNIARWRNTAPTSSVFTLASNATLNADDSPYIAYIFADVQGYSKFGAYQGTAGNNATAPFVYTGFKPSWLMVKNASATSAWEIYDSKSLGYNDKNYQLRANANDALSAVTDYVDFVSNGFKVRHNSTGINEAADNFIYMAFAESPFVTSTGVPATAR